MRSGIQRMLIRIAIFLGCCYLFLPPLPGQEATLLKKTGEELLDAQKYSLALEAFNKYLQRRPGDAHVLGNAGICYFQLGDLLNAEDYLYKALNARGNQPAFLYQYLGKVHHANLEFEKAAEFYKKFLQNIPDNHQQRASVKDDIRRCATGMRISRQSTADAVINFGEIINSAGDDFKPILSPTNPEKLYFSSTRPGNAGCDETTCRADIFFTNLTAGDWETPQPLSVFLNSIQHDVALDFSDNGEVLYFFRGETLYSGDILVDTFQENILNRTLFYTTFNKPMKSWEGDRAPYFYNDTILIFASRRKGGFGGLDLYVSTFSKGNWSAPQNLGPVINTPYDESSPFLAMNGRTLYFSSNAVHRSIGGMDILTSTYMDQSQRWSPPENLGIPFNSAADDEQFVMTADGNEAFFASSRKTGFGARDLYIALFDKPRPEQGYRSLPLTFQMVPAYQANQRGFSEAAGASASDIFEQLDSFELPVIPLPLSGGQPFNNHGKTLEMLAFLIKKFPEATFSLVVHNSPGDDVDAACEQTFEKITAFLKQENALTGNIMLRCAGASWPVDLLLPESNRRLEVYMAGNSPLPLKTFLPKFPENAFDARFFQRAMTNLIYHVVIEADSTMTAHSLNPLLNLENATLIKWPAQQRTAVTLGLYLTWASADEFKKKLEKEGMGHMKIAAYIDGREVSKEEAPRHIDRFPDLNNFMNN